MCVCVCVPHQDFLRNIPGGLLCVDLYDQWMTAMQGEGRGEAVRRYAHTHARTRTHMHTHTHTSKQTNK